MVDEEEGVRAANQGGESSSSAVDVLPLRNVYKEVWHACRNAMWCYVLTEFRSRAEQGTLKGNVDTILTMPVTIHDISSLVQSNQEFFETQLGKEKSELLTGAMHNEIDMDQRAFQEGTSTQLSHMAVLDDDRQQSELVYAISVMGQLRRIVVSFRGSVTSRDWKANLKASIRQIPNPLYEIEQDQPEFLGIHEGFRDYLYGHNPLEEKSTASDRKHPNQERRPAINNKIQVILHHVASLLQENPGYSLEMTGHSLGGALAIVCAFEAAASQDPRIRKPVNCLTIGNPKVGNLAFCSAVELMENQGKLRLLRVSNYGDMVPHVPQVAINPWRQSYLNYEYFHVGAKLWLAPKWRAGGFRLYHPMNKSRQWWIRRCMSHVWRDVKRLLFFLVVGPLMCIFYCKLGINAVAAHDLVAYVKRLEQVKEPLQNLHLEDVYNHQDDNKVSSEMKNVLAMEAL